MYQDLTRSQCRSAHLAAGSAWMLNFLRGFLLSLLLICPAGLVRAAESAQVRHSPDNSDFPDITELVNMVYAASKKNQPASEAPSAVTVVGSDEIKKYGYRTLADVLRSVRGLYVSFDRNNSFLGTRGFNRGDFNSRVLLLVDGHRMNNNLSDGALIGTD